MKKLMDMTPYELGESGTDEAVKYLIMYLSKGTANNKRLAASAIGKLADKHKAACQKALPFLIENLGDSHGQVRQYTLKALTKLNILEEYHRLIYDISQNDAMEYNRRAAKEVLDSLEKAQPEQKNDKLSVIDFVDNSSVIDIKKEEQDFINLLNSKCGIKLTDKQRAAVLHKDGPALVLAVPGAGKTTVLLARTANLIINHGVNPASILSITFSKASALDMKNRYYDFFSEITSIGANFSTIHSFCFELIRKYSIMKSINYKFIEQGDSKSEKRIILRELFKKYNGENVADDALEDMINSISYVKNMMYSEAEIADYAANLEIKHFAEIFQSYEEIKENNNYIDYDDMLTVAFNILKTEEDILQRYKSLYQYIQIDEGQDTSRIQYKLIELMAKPKDNVFVVADDDQSIYSFRGAYPKFLMEFDKMFSGTVKYFIEQNFRSTPEIVELANRFIKGNTERFNKQLHTKNASGAPVKTVKLRDEIEEADYIMAQIQASEYKESVILFRNNMAAIRLADELSRRRVEFYIRDYNRFFFKHFIVEDIRSFIHFSLNYGDKEAFRRIYYRINSYISKDTAERIAGNADNNKDIFSIGEAVEVLSSSQKGALNRLKKVFEFIRVKMPYDFIEYIEKELGYSRYLKDNCANMGYSYESLKAVLSNLKSVAARCSSLVKFLIRLDELQEVLEASIYKKGKVNITLSTIHSSKGLEFFNVFLIDLIDNIMPTRSSIEKYENGSVDELEEERRLMYVALTRAKKNLHVITLDSKNEEAVKPSRFIDELIDTLERMG